MRTDVSRSRTLEANDHAVRGQRSRLAAHAPRHDYPTWRTPRNIFRGSNDQPLLPIAHAVWHLPSVFP